MKDDSEFNITFVSLVKQFPCLYDYTSPDYSNKAMQLKAWETIANRVNESAFDCRDRWKNLRGCFTRHLKHKSSEASGHRYRKPYYLAKHLNFLLPFTKSRQQTSGDPCDGSLYQNEDEDTVAEDDDDNDNGNGNDANADDANGEEGPEDSEEQNGSEERQESDESTRTLAHKRSIKVEMFGEGGSKAQQNNGGKKMRTDRQGSDDSDLHFLRSLLPDIRSMDGSQKRRLKIGILQLCEDILNEATFHT